jgi:hypothetical protein
MIRCLRRSSSSCSLTLGALSLDEWSDVSHYHHLPAQVYFFVLCCPPIYPYSCYLITLDGWQEVLHNHHHLCPSLLFLSWDAHLLTLSYITRLMVRCLRRSSSSCLLTLGALSLDEWSDVSHYHHLPAQVYFFVLCCPPTNAIT